MPTYLTEGFYPFEFLVGDRQEIQTDNIILAAGQNLVAGAVIAKTFVGTGAGANNAGNTGNPTIGAITVGAKAQAGTYLCIFTDATHFTVFGPNDEFLGTGVLGTAFTSPQRVTFTLTAGGVAAIAGDIFNVFVTEGVSTWTAATGSDARAILAIATNATAGNLPTLAVVRLAEYQPSKVNYGAMDAAHIIAADAALARRNLIARGGM